MAITFTRAPTVAAGDAVTSTQFATLAAAFNDRLKSGLGDGPWRIFYYLFSLARQVRNPDASGYVYPSLGEFFEFYQQVQPEEAEWPLSGPGEYEGANLAAFMNAFVFGAEALNLDEESVRMAALPWDVGEPSDADAWQSAKAQRGAFDPDTGGLASPSYTAAREHWKIRSHYATYDRWKITKQARSPHGNSYGGYLPAPEVSMTGCTDPQEINYQYFFSEYSDGVVGAVHPDYPKGSCSDVPGDVAAIVEFPWAYYVVLNDGSVDILPLNQWIEGPYLNNAQLQKRDAGGVQRVLNAFASEFRGSTEQRRSQTYHLQHAFDFQRFCTSQYHLAPSIGTETVGAVQANYPKAIATSSMASGEFIPFVGSGTTHAWRSGFVLASGYISATGLLASCIIELIDGDDVIETLTVTPTAGSVSRLWFPRTAEWQPTLQLRLASSLQLSGSLEIEFTEIVRYKPNVHDYAIFLRAATALDGTPDGIGTNESAAETVSDGYFRKGCLFNVNGQGNTQPSLVAVNRNAVFDAFRRLSSCVRLIRRQEIVGYEVTGGKSILYVRRHNLSAAPPPDMWRGIGPNRDRVPSGSVEWGREYQVRTGNITYGDRTYAAGQRFIGVNGQTGYTGGTELYEADGIALTAPPQGYSNRWLLGIEFKAYHPDEASIWKPSAFSDYWPLLNRCLFYSPEVGQDVYTLNHFAFGNESGGFVLTPEAPSGYNYARLGEVVGGSWNVNTLDCAGDPGCEETRLNFYRSCRIYEPDVEIESVEWDSGSGNDEVLKVTLTGRLHHTDAAPASIDRDSSTWNIGDLQAEPFRSAENGLREYIINQTQGNHCTFGPGNQALNGTVHTTLGNPYGSCYPTIRLTKLIPEPYDDGNDRQNNADTRFEHDAFLLMELYLRAMCEGYVDGETSATFACEHLTATAFDFTYENLCLQAFGSRWMNTFDFTDSESNRQGFGPMPNTEALATQFNRMSAAVNLLTTVRVMIPSIIEMRVDEAEVIENVEALDGAGNGVLCDGASEVWINRQPDQPAPDAALGSWIDGSSGEGIVSAAVLTGACTGDLWQVSTRRQAVEFRYAPTNSDITQAFPESWRDQFNDNPNFLMSIQRTNIFRRRSVTTDILAREECGTHFWEVDPGVSWLDWEDDVETTTECGVFTSSWISPKLVRADTFYGRDGATECSERGQSLEIVITPLAIDTPILVIPLTDP